jgi:hypothetical protein
VLLPKFLLNGFETVELFRQLDAADLDQLEIRDPEQRAAVLAAVHLLPPPDAAAADVTHSEEQALNQPAVVLCEESGRRPVASTAH